MLQSQLLFDSASEAVFDALGNPVRRQMLERLRRGPLSVHELAAAFSVSRPAISRHLAQLESAGLVAHVQVGTRNVYRIHAPAFGRTAQLLDSFWDEAEARLKLVAENLGRSSDGA
ncbi:MAG: putative transcriptional regulatory protein Ars family [Hyphomicrobiales bacterium]|nr:putative transcriptional regulatory protein Ars family [Hyphomicrobiales bacterium]